MLETQIQDLNAETATMDVSGYILFILLSFLFVQGERNLFVINFAFVFKKMLNLQVSSPVVFFCPYF